VDRIADGRSLIADGRLQIVDSVTLASGNNLDASKVLFMLRHLPRYMRIHMNIATGSRLHF